jgi:cytochrome c biogenesis protein
VNRVFRRDLPLLVFHVALLALALLVAAGRLTYLNGRAEVATGEEFSELLDAQSGPLHAARLDRVRFVNDGFEIDYAPKWKRSETRNRVRWLDAHGAMHAGVIGDQTPLVLEGYRFYTTSNKGFAALFTWQPAGGALQRGAVHLPPYPMLQHAQHVDWQLPGTAERLSVRLEIDEELIDFDSAAAFRMPRDARLAITTGATARTLQAGEAMSIATGELRYEGLTTWMGYVVVSDWTTPWVLAAACLAALALAWHFWRRAFSRPWSEAHA